MTDSSAPTPPAAPSGGIEIAPGVRVDASALKVQYSRSSGPGGQNVNKVNTRAELWLDVMALAHLESGFLERLRRLAGHRLTKEDRIHIAAETGRSQEGNLQEAMDRLRDLIIQARHIPRKRRKTRPTASSRAKRLQAKKHRGQIKSGRRSRPEQE
jgi:ribosome-associated protein